MSGRLYPIPDRSRPAWFFLTLNTPNCSDNNQIIEWELLVANRHLVVQHTKTEIGDQTERELLENLMEEFHNQYIPDTELYTPDEETVRLLRSRMVLSEIPEPSLRGLQHIPMSRFKSSFGVFWDDVFSKIVEKDVAENHSDDHVDMSVHDMLELRKQAGCVVSFDAMQADAL